MFWRADQLTDQAAAPRLRRAVSRKSASDKLLGADGADGWAGGAALGGEVVGAICAERLMGPAIATIGNDYGWFDSAVSVVQEYVPRIIRPGILLSDLRRWEDRHEAHAATAAGI